jgi:hypothetical protein
VQTGKGLFIVFRIYFVGADKLISLAIELHFAANSVEQGLIEIRGLVSMARPVRITNPSISGKN